MEEIYKNLTIFSNKIKSPNPFQEPKVRFAIVGGPRTGSSNLNYKLDSHPEITCWNSEPFNVGFVYDKSCLTVNQFFSDILFKVKTPCVGFKLLWDALIRVGNKNFKKTSIFLKKRNLRLVHIQRPNILDQIISLRLAQENNIWSSFYGDYKTDQISLDFDFCKSKFEFIKGYNDQIASLSKDLPYYSITYEQVNNNDFSGLFDFLEVGPAELHSQLKKQRKKDQCDSISNYYELKEQFKDTEFYQYFEN